MAESFILSCESTGDLPYAYVSGRNMPVLFYTYTVDGQEYTDDMGRDPEALPKFYSFLEEGKLPTTSQLNLQTYLDFFETLLPKGDVLHIAFGSGMTNSVANALQAAELLKEKYPERKLVVIDSLCSSSGYGLLVDTAADMRDDGKSLEEIAEWVRQNCNKVHHQFYSVDLKYFRRSGRMSGAAATVAAILNICPIMRLNSAGKIIAYDKVRGRKNAIRRTVDTMEEHAQGGRNYSGKCFICHSNSLEDAEQTKIAVKERFPNISGEIRICDIGTIIASHCGPGTVAVFFFGDERAD
jgi:DegV family protein with EDD domain